jgi:Dyp-type peroxidase family
MTEPILAIDDIQGNIEPGFRLPFQKVVALRLKDTETAAAALAYLLPIVTTMRTAMDFHADRIRKAKAQHVFGVRSYQLTAGDVFWMNVHLGRDLLAKLQVLSPAAADASFQAGLYQQSKLLGDPQDSGAEGYTDNWVIGSKDRLSDILLVLGSTTADVLHDRAAALLAGLEAVAGYDLLYQEDGARLADGREHFGFPDGVSQPYLRGVLRSAPVEYYNPRTIVAGNDSSDDPEYSAPGKMLIWPGQYIFGYPMQSGTDYRQPIPGNTDPQLKNGSFLVFRRLRQDVKAFYDFTAQQSAVLKTLDAAYADPDLLRSKLIGRSKQTGDSVLFTGAQPNDLLNHFNYIGALGTMKMADGAEINSTVSDPLATTCPYFAHIRKVNPRDAPNNRGDGRATLTLRILRRGIPFGPVYDHLHTDNPVNASERGLLFLGYQSSIRDQFEVLVFDWMNSAVNPEGGPGYDLLIGQNNNTGQNRVRSAQLPVNGQLFTISCPTDFVIPTGGEYLFAPSLTLLRTLVGVNSP